MKTLINLSLLSLVVALLCSANIPTNDEMAVGQPSEEVIEANNLCFSCHGQKLFTYYNPELDREIKDNMCDEKIVNEEKFYLSNHRTFQCIGCHSADYESFPHPGELRFEQQYACNDCHGYDDDWAHFKFDEIEEEFMKSVHSTNHDEAFTCWMCHDPHEYHITYRNEENLLNTIAYDNGICLTCHADVNRYQLLTDKEKPNVDQQHSWLPNQQLHFTKVRCIECHAELNDNVLVAHNIRPKEEAVKKCVECHSSDSRLMASLYSHTVKTERWSGGFVNGEMVTQGFVIGANRNKYLNQGSLYIFLGTLAIILIHSILRAIYIKK